MIMLLHKVDSTGNSTFAYIFSAEGVITGTYYTYVHTQGTVKVLHHGTLGHHPYQSSFAEINTQS